jgi:hypothetical protein
VLLHLEGVVDGDLGVPARDLADGDAVYFGGGQGLDDLQRPLLVVEKVVVGAEEISKAILLVEAAHLVGDARGALEAVLPLVVGGDGAVGAGELAAERHHQGADRAVPAHLVCGQRLRGERGTEAARRLEQRIA